MAFRSSTEQIFLLKEIAETTLKKNATKVDSEFLWPEENIQTLKDAGLGGLTIPKSLGGHGQGLLAMAQACEILGASCASTSMCYGMHLVGSMVMSAKATKYHQEKFLTPIAEGKHWTTLSLSEPGTGSHFYIPETLMNDEGNSLVLNGKKSFVTNGGYADSYVMNAIYSDNRSDGQFSCAIIPNDNPGLKWGDVWKGLGMRGNSSRSVELQNVRIPKENLLGEVGDQIWYVFEVVAPSFLVAMSGTYLGIAVAALNEAIDHVKTRHQNHTGNTLAHVHTVQHRIGVLWAKVEKTRQLIYSAALQGDNNEESAVLSIMSAKAEVAECCVQVVNEAMTLMGGEGYSLSGLMERHLRDARASHVMAPTTDILRTWTGRALLGVPLLGE